MAALVKKPGASAADPRKLPKEFDVKFSTVITCYERKEYKRGIKISDEILKKYPNHGETQAMRGLIYNCMDDKEQAYEWVKLGLKNDIRSHVCWHVYGLIYRSDNNYKEASKCYLNALRINPGNQNIMRDLSWLQVQLRDFDTFVKTRRKILENKPGLRTNWVALAMAHFGAGEYEAAYKVVEKCQETHKDEPSEWETSELLLFQNRCLEIPGQYAMALDHLKKITPQVVDKLSVRVKTAEMLTLSGKFTEALTEWMSLLHDQPENYRYHAGMQAAALELDEATCKRMLLLKALKLPSSELQLSSAQCATLQTIYDKEPALNQKFSATSMHRICFTFQNGDVLRKNLQTHVMACLRKGVPSVYEDVCDLVRSSGEDGRKEVIKDTRQFADHALVKDVCAWVEEWVSQLRKTEKFPGSDKVEDPTTLLWAMVLMTHLLERKGELQSALLYCDECIAHTPTATDLYMRKAKILKKMGNLDEAANIADAGRDLDLQDRYLNNKATKYALRADKIDKANDLMAMFARYEGDPQQYLAEMQCNWYELEAGESHARQKQWGPALKKFYSIQKHFADYVEDMFDFHGFCVRKTSLRAHSDAVAMQNTVWAHPFYQRACRGALTVLLHLIDMPDDIDGLGHLDTKQRKKERERRKKQKAKDKAAAELRLQEEAEEAKRFNDDTKVTQKPDLDKDGDLFLARNFLEETGSWVAKLSPHFDKCEPATLALISEVHIRRSKPVQAMRALSAGLRRNPGHPDLTPALLRLHMRITHKATKSQKCLSQNPMAMTVVNEEFTNQWMFGTGTASEYVDALKATAIKSGSVSARLAAAMCKMTLEVNNKDSAKAAAAELLQPADVVNAIGSTAKSLNDVMGALQKWEIPELLANMQEQAASQYPMATIGLFVRASDGEADGRVAEVEEIA